MMRPTTSLPYFLESDWFSNIYENHRGWLEDLDRATSAPEALTKSIENEPLGKMFERYVGFWLRESPLFTLHAQNIQVITDQTIGEFDFIFSDDQQVYHLEVACKFYLSKSNSSDWHEWIGPNGIDSLDEKMTTLKRQLQLSKHPQGAFTLRQLGFHSVQPLAMMKGFFFHHYKDILSCKSPRHCSKDYNTGWWIFADELEDFVSVSATYVMLSKNEWIAAWHQADQGRITHGVQCIEKCKNEIAFSRSAVALVQVIEEEGMWVEISRGFVVDRTLFHRSNQFRKS